MPTSTEKTEIAISRLENPWGLDEEKILMYQDYLFGRREKTAVEFIDNNIKNILPLLVKYRVIKKSNIVRLTDYARENRKTDILFYLMEAGNILRAGGRNTVVKKHIPGKTKLPPAENMTDLSAAKAGDILWLGSQLIPWQVLENKDNKILLISKYALAVMPYKNFYIHLTGWNNSSVKLKLDTEYLPSLFSRELTEKIIPVYIDDEDDSLSFEKRDTVKADRFFLLSKAEAEKYFRTPKSLMAPATKRCLISPQWTVFGRYAHWWLRSPGNHPLEKMYVRDGLITSENSIVNGDDCFDYFGVRPAVWLKV